MFFRLFATFFALIAALFGTAAGNGLRMLIDPELRKRYTTPDTGDVMITGVLSNGLIATLIAVLTGGRRLWGAFVGGVVLTLVLGDRLDRKPFDFSLSVKKENTEKQNTDGKTHPNENIATGGIPDTL